LTYSKAPLVRPVGFEGGLLAEFHCNQSKYVRVHVIIIRCLCVRSIDL